MYYNFKKLCFEKMHRLIFLSRREARAKSASAKFFEKFSTDFSLRKIL